MMFCVTRRAEKQIRSCPEESVSVTLERVAVYGSWLEPAAGLTCAIDAVEDLVGLNTHHVAHVIHSWIRMPNSDSRQTNQERQGEGRQRRVQYKDKDRQNVQKRAECRQVLLTSY